MTQVDTFAINGTAWAACEDLQRPDGAIALIPATGVTEWFTKGYVALPPAAKVLLSKSSECKGKAPLFQDTLRNISLTLTRLFMCFSLARKRTPTGCATSTVCASVQCAVIDVNARSGLFLAYILIR